MSDYLKELLNKKNLISILILAILVMAVPLTINLVRQRQISKSRAVTGNEIKFVEKTGELECVSDKCTTTKPDVQVEIQAPGDTEFK